MLACKESENKKKIENQREGIRLQDLLQPQRPAESSCNSSTTRTPSEQQQHTRSHIILKHLHSSVKCPEGKSEATSCEKHQEQ